ncbi:hypothetical protein RCIX2170 [Methanocella arvoryzae MRE50]|uniref:DUF1405 domain-containing protein n=2 Tax=Methanocella TaxID=570266 RepID=Q0W2V1_METAR|nr:hypothetical protein RCIX2170 [Methanocella arvoryzae MRE50]
MGDRRLLVIFLLINVAGSLFGLYYYWEQLMLTPWYLWLAVPDCPLYTFFMIFALLLILLKKPSDTLNTITAVGLSMYGAWTTIVLLYFGEIYFNPANALMSAGLWISHFCMGLEGFLLLPYLARVKPISWAITAIWFAVLDSVDYFYHFAYNGVAMRTHPLALLEYLAASHHATALVQKIDSLMYLTFSLSIIFFVLMIILAGAYAGGSQKTVIKEKIRN